MNDSPEIVVAFQGEHGAYSEQAVRQQFGAEVTTLPCRSFADIFAAVQTQTATYGLLPVENSLAGTVIPAYDELIDQDLRVIGEEIVHVKHCLMAPAGTKVEELKRAISHHQALAQTAKTLARLGIEPVVHYDTAGAARDLARNPQPHTAAIASELAAQTYGLEILVRDIQDEPGNYTRFFVLGREDRPYQAGANKTSVVFTTRHAPGALHAVLGELASRHINLTKLESRPRRNRPWHYYFFVDFEGHEEEPSVRSAMLAILKHSSFLKVLGSFPAAPIPELIR
jgi:prephenate dehydratase